MITLNPSTRAQFDCTVVENVPLCREHYRLVLRAAGFPPTFPGQFIQIACRDWSLDYDPQFEIAWDGDKRPEVDGPEFEAPLAFLRRPFSLAGRRDFAGYSELDIIHRVVGVGTDWMAKLTEGDAVNILGPLGNRFELPRPDQSALLVGGGVGIPPMLYMAQAVAGRAIAFCGALTKNLLPLKVVKEAAREATPDRCIEEFARHDIPTVVTTDDGSFGRTGYVTEALENWLDAPLRASVRLSSPKSVPSCLRASLIIYTCGPEPMMKRVAQIAKDRGIECQVAVERAMACGMGTCQSCCIRVRKPDPAKPPLVGRDWCYRLACTDGPVFRGADLLW